MSSSGLRLLLFFHSRQKPGTFILAGIQKNVRLILTMSGFLKNIPIAETVEEAMHQVKIEN